MSYALGQAKWVPGQIAFMNTRTGRLPSVQPLIEAGLPYAPYIEHGSFVTGQPDIARYGRDPYRGIMGMGSNGDDLEAEARQRADQMQEAVTETAQETVRVVAKLAILIGLGAGVGAAAGALGGLLGKPLRGGLAGGVGGGILGYLAYRQLETV